MKAFTTISALLGITYANPVQYGSTGLRNINQYSSNVMTNKDMHPMSNTQIMTQRTGPIMNIVADMPKPAVNPNQYLEKDNFGNYAFGYSTQNSEMSEVGNAQSKKGHFANIMADGKMRRVDYVADNQGFRILRDTADNTGRYIKREAEAEPSVQPDLIRSRMTSYMESNSLRDDLQMSNNMLSRDMTSFNIEPNMDHLSTIYRSSNMMSQGMSSNMMSQGMSSNLMGRDMTSNRLGLNLSPRMMGRDMLTNMRNNNMDIPRSRTMYTNMMGGRDTTSLPTLKMSQDMYSNTMENNDKMMSSNILMGSNVKLMAPLNRMSQRMQIETMPSQSLNRFF